jgi:thiamine biosynthesis lipoprotein
VITSGTYERYYEYNNTRYSHILDPRSGMPVQDLTSVTVIDRNGALADVAATALMIAGPSAWQQIAKKMGIHYVMLIDKAGTVTMNSAMAKRVRFQPPKQPTTVISEFSD